MQRDALRDAGAIGIAVAAVSLRTISLLSVAAGRWCGCLSVCLSVRPSVCPCVCVCCSQVVPTKFERLNGETYDAYQFVSNSNHIVGRFQLPAIYFRYDFSPITVAFKEKKSSFAHFLVQVCAIVGGVFTVLGLVTCTLNTNTHGHATMLSLARSLPSIPPLIRFPPSCVCVASLRSTAPSSLRQRSSRETSTSLDEKTTGQTFSSQTNPSGAATLLAFNLCSSLRLLRIPFMC